MPSKVAALFLLPCIIALAAVASPIADDAAGKKVRAPPAVAAKARSIAVEASSDSSAASDFMFIKQYVCGSDDTCGDCELRDSVITHRCLAVGDTAKSMEASCNGTVTYVHYEQPDCQGPARVVTEPTKQCTFDKAEGVYRMNTCYSPCN